MASNGEDDFNNPKRHLNYEQFIEKKDKQNVVVIDVRERSEISETGQIPGSINIPCKHFAYITFFFFFFNVMPFYSRSFTKFEFTCCH